MVAPLVVRLMLDVRPTAGAPPLMLCVLLILWVLPMLGVLPMPPEGGAVSSGPATLRNLSRSTAFGPCKSPSVRDAANYSRQKPVMLVMKLRRAQGKGVQKNRTFLEVA